MKISAAIMLGSTMIAPLAGHHLYYDPANPHQGPTHGCAWGMVNVAAPRQWGSMNIWAATIAVTLPCGCRGMIVKGQMRVEMSDGIETVQAAIIHLFNHHVMTEKDWTMDKLVDWVQTIEPPDFEDDPIDTLRHLPVRFGVRVLDTATPEIAEIVPELVEVAP